MSRPLSKREPDLSEPFFIPCKLEESVAPYRGQSPQNREKWVSESKITFPATTEKVVLGADFWEVDLDSNFSIFGVRRFTEWPGPLH